MSKHRIDLTEPPYNVNADGVTDCTDAIIKAAQELEAVGGGCLNLPTGDYVTTLPVAVFARLVGGIPASLVITEDGLPVKPTRPT